MTLLLVGAREVEPSSPQLGRSVPPPFLPAPMQKSIVKLLGASIFAGSGGVSDAVTACVACRRHPCQRGG